VIDPELHILTKEESDELTKKQFNHLEKILDLKNSMKEEDSWTLEKLRRVDTSDNWSKDKKTLEIHSIVLGEVHRKQAYYEEWTNYLSGQVQILESCIGELEKRLNEQLAKTQH
jgi:hypothetical protein